MRDPRRDPPSAVAAAGDARPAPSTTTARPRWLWVLLWLVVATNGAWLVSCWLVDRPASGYLTFWDGWLSNGAQIAAVALAVAVVAREQRSRVGWSLIAAALVSYTVADLLFAFVDRNQSPVPVPAWSDGPYLLFYVLFALGILLVTNQGYSVTNRATRVDGAIAGLAIASVVVAVWFESALHRNGRPAAIAVALIYPLFDVVLIVTLFAGLAGQLYRPHRSGWLLTAGIALFTLADVAYLTRSADGTYVPNGWTDACWNTGIVLFALAAWFRRPPAVEPARPVTSGLLAIPTAAGLVALTVLVAGVIDRVNPWALALAELTLAIVLVRALATVRDLRNAHNSHREARTDDLTGLTNRRGFDELLEHHLTLDRPGAVVTLDLDGFKEVNDSLGHPAGDQLLRLVAGRFVPALPKSVQLARLGGDEFAFVCRGGDGAVVGRRLLDALREPFLLDGIAVRVGASVGWARFPDHGVTSSELMRAADVAMYRAKRRRLGVVEYVADVDPHSRERLAMVEDLRTALDAGTIGLAFQPIIEARSGRVTDVEALVRWQHPTHGAVSAATVVALAEQYGLVSRLTHQVVDLGLAALATLRAAGFDLSISVNISGHDLVDDDLPTYVASTLATHGVDPSNLTLEITETVLASDPGRATRTVERLRDGGVRIAIDDFGVGFSSMMQLLALSFDEIKVDRSFVVAADRDKGRAVLGATVGLGRSLGARVVAEGVETIEALTLVVAAGADFVQGYFIARPMPVASLQQFLTDFPIPVDPTSFRP